jgi:protein-tyrosine-phosphatase
VKNHIISSQFTYITVKIRDNLIEKPRRILFKSRYNICRSVAAEVILKTFKPQWIIFSCSTSPDSIGRTFFQEMVYALECNHYCVFDQERKAVYQDWIIEHMGFFDEIHDLHIEGISDPMVTGDFHQTVAEIEDYIKTLILNG